MNIFAHPSILRPKGRGIKPQGIKEGDKVGCQDLLDRVKQVKPKIHAFGHIHEGYGMVELDGTISINACNVDRDYRLVNPAIEVEL